MHALEPTEFFGLPKQLHTKAGVGTGRCVGRSQIDGPLIENSMGPVSCAASIDASVGMYCVSPMLFPGRGKPVPIELISSGDPPPIFDGHDHACGNVSTAVRYRADSINPWLSVIRIWSAVPDQTNVAETSSPNQ